MRRLALAIASCSLAALAASGENPVAQPRAQQAEGPVFPIDVEMVNLTLSVRDDSGRLVSDLGADDFTVYEEGQPQAIGLFARAVEPGNEETLALDLGMLRPAGRLALPRVHPPGARSPHGLLRP
jgi:hypothetical protein